MDGLKVALIIWPWFVALAGLVSLRSEVSEPMQIAIWVVVGLALLILACRWLFADVDDPMRDFEEPIPPEMSKSVSEWLDTK